MSTNFGLFNTSVMGMSSQSDALATVAENIANSGTVGYKKTNTSFSTVLTGVQGAEMIGGGVTTKNRTEVASQGALTHTASATDIAIQGKGFFVVSDPNGAIYLTRAGSFVPDSQGRLVNSAGYYLMGFDINNAPTGSSTNAVTSMSIVRAQADKLYATPTTRATLAANIPSSASVVTNLPSTNAANAQYTARTSMTVFDNLGASIQLDVYFSKKATGWEFTVFNHADANATSGGFPYATAALDTRTLTFNSDGSYNSGGPSTFTVPGGQAMTLDLSSTTQLAASFGVNSLNVNGSAAGAVQSIQIASDGMLSYTLSNGLPVPMYKVGLANVASPNNMISVTGNVFTVTSESGPLMIGDPGTVGLGLIQSNALENSTVDLASELSAMIIAQRSYTANTQVFQVASEVLQVLNNLK